MHAIVGNEPTAVTHFSIADYATAYMHVHVADSRSTGTVQCNNRISCFEDNNNNNIFYIISKRVGLA